MGGVRGGSLSLLSSAEVRGGVAITCGQFRGAAGRERGGRWRAGGVTWLRRVEQPGAPPLSDLL